MEMLREEILLFLEEHGATRESLLPLMENLQRRSVPLDKSVLNEVARSFSLSLTEVFSIASFYHFLDFGTKGKYSIYLCQTIGCHLQGKDQIVKALQAELGITIGETTKDGLYSLNFANCMGMCDQGPAMLVNQDLYSLLTPSRAIEIIHSYS